VSLLGEGVGEVAEPPGSRLSPIALVLAL